MALVVTARSPVEAQPGLHPSAFARRPLLGRLQAGLGWLAVGSAAWYGLGLVTDNLRRTASLTDLGLAADQLPRSALSLDVLSQGVSVGAAGLALVVCVVAWLSKREAAGLLLAATLAPILVAVRALSTGLLVTLELPTLADVADVGLGLLALGCLVWVASAALIGTATTVRVPSAEAQLFRRVVEVTALVAFAAALTGVTVRAVGASWACQANFPDCNGLGVLPFGRDPLADIQLYHRLLAYATLTLVVWVAVEAFRTQRGLRSVGRASLVLLASTVAQGVLGAASVSGGNLPLMQALHLVGAAATWSAAVVLAGLSRGQPVPAAVILRPQPKDPTRRRNPSPLHTRAAPAQDDIPREGWPAARILSAYVQLTKPRVMSLLLATTATAMIIAARGMPPLAIFVWTLVGGALMSGGAGAINHYVDRDIDPLMGRTAGGRSLQASSRHAEHSGSASPSACWQARSSSSS